MPLPRLDAGEMTQLPRLGGLTRHRAAAAAPPAPAPSAPRPRPARPAPAARRGGRVQRTAAAHDLLAELDALHEIGPGIEMQQGHEPLIERHGLAVSGPARARRNSVSPSRGKALERPETQPTAPTMTLSITTSSRPAKSTKRSPTRLRTSVKRRVSPEESLKATMVSQPASAVRISGVTSVR